MWHPGKVLSGPSSEPVTTATARSQCRVDACDKTYDADLKRMIKAARAHTEKYCNIRLGAQTVEVECDSFNDMARMSEAPVASISSIIYTDADGAQQTLAGTVYELRANGYEAAVVLKDGQSWPHIKRGSRIKMTALVGVSPVPADILHAMLLMIAYWFKDRESVNVGNIVNTMPHTFDALLSNHRRYS